TTQQLLHDLARDAALGGQGDVRPLGAADAVDPGLLPDGGDPVRPRLEHVEGLGAPEARIGLLAGVVEEAGRDGPPRCRAAHEHDAPLVAGDEGPARGRGADRQREESLTEGGTVRRAVDIGGHRTTLLHSGSELSSDGGTAYAGTSRTIISSSGRFSDR